MTIFTHNVQNILIYNLKTKYSLFSKIFSDMQKNLFLENFRFKRIAHIIHFHKTT